MKLLGFRRGPPFGWPGRTNWSHVALIGLPLLGCTATDVTPESVEQVQQEASLEAPARLPLKPTACFANWQNTTEYKTQVTTIRERVKQWEAISGLRVSWTDACKTPTKNSAGNEEYPEDIRIQLTPQAGGITGNIPGVGCQNKDASGGPWASYPSGRAAWRNCKYNMHLVYNQPANNDRHEFGHALGFLHEHVRDDSLIACRNPGEAIASGNHKVLAKYDYDSVMNYVFATRDASGTWTPWPGCEMITNNNWGTFHDGISAGDLLAAKVLYPENQSAIPFGNRLTWAGATLTYATEMAAQGVMVTDDPATSMFKSFQWKWDGALVGSASTVKLSKLTSGTHTLSLAYNDIFDEGAPRSSYSGSITVTVLSSKQEYMKRVAATASAMAAL